MGMTCNDEHTQHRLLLSVVRPDHMRMHYITLLETLQCIHTLLTAAALRPLQ